MANHLFPHSNCLCTSFLLLGRRSLLCSFSPGRHCKFIVYLLSISLHHTVGVVNRQTWSWASWRLASSGADRFGAWPVDTKGACQESDFKPET